MKRKEPSNAKDTKALDPLIPVTPSTHGTKFYTFQPNNHLVNTFTAHSMLRIPTVDLTNMKQEFVLHTKIETLL